MPTAMPTAAKRWPKQPQIANELERTDHVEATPILPPPPPSLTPLDVSKWMERECQQIKSTVSGLATLQAGAHSAVVETVSRPRAHPKAVTRVVSNCARMRSPAGVSGVTIGRARPWRATTSAILAAAPFGSSSDSWRPRRISAMLLGMFTPLGPRTVD